MTVRDGGSPEERRALFRVVSGDPDDAELAALTVVLAAAAASAQGPPAAAPASTWSDRAALLRGPALGGLPAAGPHAWRASAWPR